MISFDHLTSETHLARAGDSFIVSMSILCIYLSFAIVCYILFLLYLVIAGGGLESSSPPWQFYFFTIICLFLSLAKQDTISLRLFS